MARKTLQNEMMDGQNLHHLIKYQDYNIILLLETQIFNIANSQGLLVIFHHIKGIWCSSNNNNNNKKKKKKTRMSQILWDMPIHTDRKITANRPDIVIKDHKMKTCKFIDMAVPSDRNTSVKVTEKLSKYKDLEIETSRMWGMRTETIPVIIGALGAIKKGLEAYLGRIPGQLSISELQKITLLGTAHILRRVLSI